MAPLSIAQMKELIEKFERLRQLDQEIPQAYIDRLRKASELFEKVNKTPHINWDDLKSIDDIERAAALISEKAELKEQIERHLNTCGLTVRIDSSHGRTTQKRRIRRSPQQKKYDDMLKDIFKAKKEELGLPWKGKIKDEDKDRLEKAVDKELKRLKLAPPASAGESD